MNQHIENLNLAAHHIDAIIKHTSGAHCCYFIMNEVYLSNLKFRTLARDSRGNPLVVGDHYMGIVCENGYKYLVNITGDSVLTACAEVFQFVQNKL